MMRGYTLGLYEKAMPNDFSLVEKLAAAKAAGFDYMELSVDESEEKLARLEWDREARKQVLVGMSDIGVHITSMCLSAHRKYPLGSEDETVRRRSMEIMAGAIDLAYDLGIRIIQLAGYDEYYRPSTKETRRLFAKSLAASVALASRKAVMLAFETMETEFLNTVEKAMTHIRVIDSPYLGVYPDLGNITNAAVSCGRDVLDDLETGRGHIAALHLKETKPGVFRDMSYGTGHVDFEEGVRKARSLGVGMYVGEFWYAEGRDWRNDLRTANTFLRANLDRVYAREG